MQRRLDPAADPQSLVLSLGLGQQDLLPEQLPQIERLLLRHITALLQLGVVEHPVEDRQQVLAGLAQGLQVAASLSGLAGVGQQLGHAEDAADGGADLVADAGEKLRARLAGGFRRLLGLAQAARAFFDPAAQLLATEQQLLVGPFAAVDVLVDRQAHVVERLGHRIEFVAARRWLTFQLQRRIARTAAQAAGIAGHALQVSGDQALEDQHDHQHHQEDGQGLAEKQGQGAAAEAGIDGAQIGMHHQLTQVARAQGRLVKQLESVLRGTLSGLRPRVQDQALTGVGVLQGQRADVGEVEDAAHLQAQLLLVDVPDALGQTAQVDVTNQLDALLDHPHLAAVLDDRLDGGGQDHEQQAADQHVAHHAVAERVLLAIGEQFAPSAFRGLGHRGWACGGVRRGSGRCSARPGGAGCHPRPARADAGRGAATGPAARVHGARRGNSVR